MVKSYVHPKVLDSYFFRNTTLAGNVLINRGIFYHIHVESPGVEIFTYFWFNHIILQELI
ncbi:MAG: hypothetical protein AMS27_01810 [Bacteroides sp. SM23_62_1]|nr:MAG: hypothetical protein AMS27_01810 [Bacteroides sp. SM23_62_1]